jgi:hypothetical protein
MHDIFVVGSVWFWLLLVAEAALVIALIEWGEGFVATASLIVTLLLLQFMGDTNVLGFANNHPIVLVFGVIGYFATGTFWSIARWWMFVRDQRMRYRDARRDFCEQHDLEGSIPEIPQHLQGQWQDYLQSLATRRRKIEIRPLVRQHRGRILMWMAYWPWSLVWTILHDPVRNAFKVILHHLHDYLQEISDNAFKGVEADFPPEPKKPESAPAPPDNSAHSTNGSTEPDSAYKPVAAKGKHAS